MGSRQGVVLQFGEGIRAPPRASELDSPREYGNEPSGSMKYGEFLGYLSDC
jgi:hypothetical protein